MRRIHWPTPDTRLVSSLVKMTPQNLIICVAVLFGAVWISSAASKPKTHAPKIAALEFHSAGHSDLLRLRGADARQQLLVTARLQDGSESDFTRTVTYDVKPAGIVKVDTNGFIIPLRDGQATIAAKADGVRSAMNVVVENFRQQMPVNFPNQIVPIF